MTSFGNGGRAAAGGSLETHTVGRSDAASCTAAGGRRLGPPRLRLKSRQNCLFWTDPCLRQLFGLSPLDFPEPFSSCVPWPPTQGLVRFLSGRSSSRIPVITSALITQRDWHFDRELPGPENLSDLRC